MTNSDDIGAELDAFTARSGLRVPGIRALVDAGDLAEARRQFELLRGEWRRHEADYLRSTPVPDDALQAVRYAICRERPIDAELTRRITLAVWAQLDRDEQGYVIANSVWRALPRDVWDVVKLEIDVRGPQALAWYDLQWRPR